MSIYNIIKKNRFSSVFLTFFIALFLFAVAPVEVLARAGCFVGGTNILTPNGQIPVEKLVSGDSIISYNIDTKQKELSTVKNVMVYQEKSYYLINGKTEVTAVHPFYVNRNGQLHVVEVKDLLVGDELLADNNEITPVTSLQVFDKPVLVYNLEEVTPNNNYFANDLLVHNKGGGGCFLPDTQIQTPSGMKPISSLKKGDSVVSWDEKNKRNQISTLGRIDVLEVDDFYQINNKIQVTGTHPFYVVSQNGISLKEVSKLKRGDILTDGNKNIEINSISHVMQKALVYNLVNVEPYNNYFADGVLVHNKGGGGGHSSSGGRGHSSSGGSSEVTPFVYNGKSYSSIFSCNEIAYDKANSDCKWFFLRKYLIMGGFGVMWLIMFFSSARAAKKSSIKKGQNFSTDQELIDYVKKIVPKFTNTYDPYYSSDTENWSPIVSPPAVSPALYQNLATVDVFLAKIQELYERYQSDWTNKNFEAMKTYMKEPYFSKQKQIFKSSFGKNFDVVFKPKILSATPLKVDLKIDGEIVRVQINGEMIDFEVASSGKVLSGVPNVRGFTEYWNIFIDLEKRYYIVDLEN